MNRAINFDEARASQRLLDESLGDQDLAERLAHPVIVREIDQDEARRMWPDFCDTVPTGWGDEL